MAPVAPNVLMARPVLKPAHIAPLVNESKHKYPKLRLATQGMRKCRGHTPYVIACPGSHTLHELRQSSKQLSRYLPSARVTTAAGQLVTSCTGDAIASLRV